MGDDLVLHAAVTLLASGRAKDPDEAIGVALRVVADCRAALARARQRKPARPPKRAPRGRPAPKGARAPQLGVRARRLLEKMGVVRPHDLEVSPRVVAKKVCRAHLDAARGSGPATIGAVAQWLEASGERLQDACATFDANWLTNRCDEKPG